MIQSVTVTNHNGESIELVLTRPELSGLAIQSIEGLGPPNASIFSNTLATKDGSVYSGAQCQDRNIVFHLLMFETIGRSIEECRHIVYRYFPIKKRVKMRFLTDFRDLEIEGYVERNEPDIFSSTESASVSVICPDPWFYDYGESQEFFTGVISQFEFPFSNEISEDARTNNIIMSTRDPRDTVDFECKSDVDVGMIARIDFLGTTGNIHIYNRGTNEEFIILMDKVKRIIGGEVMSSDYILISTRPGNKYAQYYRSGLFYKNIIAGIDRNSDWFLLTIGLNRLAYAADSGGNLIRVGFSYQNAYGGL